MAHDKTNELPTPEGLPTNAEDDEMDKEATDEQERRKEPRLLRIIWRGRCSTSATKAKFFSLRETQKKQVAGMSAVD